MATLLVAVVVAAVVALLLGVLQVLLPPREMNHKNAAKKKYPNFLGAKGPVILLLTLLVTHVFLLTPSKGPEPFDPEVPEWREDWSPLQSQVLSRFVGPASSEKEGGGKEARVTNFGKGATTGILFTPSGQQRGKKTR